MRNHGIWSHVLNDFFVEEKNGIKLRSEVNDRKWCRIYVKSEVGLGLNQWNRLNGFRPFECNCKGTAFVNPGHTDPSAHDGNPNASFLLGCGEIERSRWLGGVGNSNSLSLQKCLLKCPETRKDFNTFGDGKRSQIAILVSVEDPLHSIEVLRYGGRRGKGQDVSPHSSMDDTPEWTVQMRDCHHYGPTMVWDIVRDGRGFSMILRTEWINPIFTTRNGFP